MASNPGLKGLPPSVGIAFFYGVLIYLAMIATTGKEEIKNNCRIGVDVLDVALRRICSCWSTMQRLVASVDALRRSLGLPTLPSNVHGASMTSATRIGDLPGSPTLQFPSVTSSLQFPAPSRISTSSTSDQHVRKRKATEDVMLQQLSIDPVPLDSLAIDYNAVLATPTIVPISPFIPPFRNNPFIVPSGPFSASSYGYDTNPTTSYNLDPSFTGYLPVGLLGGGVGHGGDGNETYRGEVIVGDINQDFSPSGMTPLTVPFAGGMIPGMEDMGVDLAAAFGGIQSASSTPGTMNSSYPVVGGTSFSTPTFPMSQMSLGMDSSGQNYGLRRSNAPQYIELPGRPTRVTDHWKRASGLAVQTAPARPASVPEPPNYFFSPSNDGNQQQ